MNKDCVISVDLGTSSVRACLVNSDLTILFNAQEPLDLTTDFKGKAEQDPDRVLDASLRTISQAADYARKQDFTIAALSFSNAVSSLVQLSADYRPMGNFLTYADIRSFNEVEILREQYQLDFFMNSAVPLHASYWLPKILWLKNKGLVHNSTRFFCTIKDLLVYQLTGRFITDQSNAVATGICDAETIDWRPAYLQIMDLNSTNFPKIFPTTEKLDIKPELKSRLGLPENTMLVLGATDGVLSSLGAGAVNPGQVTTMIGSSGACRIAANSPLLTDENLTWSYPLADGIWIRGGAMNSGGLVAEWLIDNFYSDLETDQPGKFQRVFEEICAVSAASDGLIFLPYIFGERAPIWDEKARGVFFGIHKQHGRPHFARAVFEGIIYSLFSIFEIIQTSELDKIEIRATGGYTRSDEFLQLQADIFAHQICVPNNHEGSSMGAAVLAFFSLGIFKNLRAASDLIGIKNVIKPKENNCIPYQEAYRKFKNLYSVLKPEFRRSQ
jgi:gluconokinase